MQRHLAWTLVVAVFAACSDSIRPTAPLLDVVPNAPASAGTNYQWISLENRGDRFHSMARALNNHDEVVGWASTTATDAGECGFPSPFCTPPPAHAVLWEHEVVRDLGTLGGTRAEATDLNERGQVVGWSTVADGSAHAFFWDDDTMQDLGPVLLSPPIFWGLTLWSPVHINKRGQVIGNRPAGKPFLWERGGSQELPLDFAMAINDEGKVVGGVMAPNAAGVLKRRAALWEDGVVTDLGTLGGDESWAVAIGKNGWIAGSSKTEPRKVFNRPNLIPVTIAFRWRDGVMEDLGLPGNESEWRVPPLVSDQGNVVVQDPTQCVSLIWEDVAWQVIGPGCTYVQAMNAQGAVTGARNSFSVGPAFVWQHGVRQDLAVPGRGSRGNAINNQGIVVGNTGNNGVPQAAMWVPVAAALQVN